MRTMAITLLLAFAALGKDITVTPGDSLTKARDEVKAGDRIILHGGIYRLGETLVLGPGNSGIAWMAAPGERPVLSGGVAVTGWTSDVNGVWKAHLSRTEKLRQLYVNGKPAHMARLKKAPQGERGSASGVLGSQGMLYNFADDAFKAFLGRDDSPCALIVTN